MTVEGRILCANFEESTITILLPEGFWDKHKIRAANATVESIGIIEVFDTGGRSVGGERVGK